MVDEQEGNRMELKEQVISVANAKRLKELGVKQDSLFYWVISLTTNYHISYTEGDKSLLPQDRNDFYAAFTVAELGELLPLCYMSWATPQTGKMKWWCHRMETHAVTHEVTEICTALTEADVRAAMLIYLLEQKLEGKHDPYPH